MTKGHSKFISLILLAGDIILLNGSLFIASLEVSLSGNRVVTYSYYPILLLLNLLWVLVAVFFGEYTIYRVKKNEIILLDLLKTLAVHLLSFLSLAFLFNGSPFSTQFILTSYAIFSVSVSFWRFFAISGLKWYRAKGFNYRRVIILGAGPVGQAMRDFFESDFSHGYRFLGFFDDDPAKYASDQPVMGTIDESKKFAIENNVEEVYCALPDSAGDKVRDIIKFCDKSLIRVKIIPDFMRYIPKKVNIDFYGSIPVILIRKEPLEKTYNRLAKRTFDLVFSALIIITVFSWLFPLIALLIKATSKGPVFFRQKRSGELNRDFMCLKFRTMRESKDADLVQATKNDQRLTSVGKILRKTNLDEFPQFINVLRGEMSVVGPRPHMLKHTEEYSSIINGFMIRHFAKPGITGWAQANGFRGETKDPSLMRRRVLYDVFYIENWNFIFDLRIIFLTIWNMLKGEKNAV